MTMIVTAGKRRALQVRSAPNKLTERRFRSFLEHLAATCNVTEAASAAGVSKEPLYRRRRLDAAFAAAWREAIQAGYERLEEALLAHALSEVEFDADAIAVEMVDDADADNASGGEPDGGAETDRSVRSAGPPTGAERTARASAARRNLAEHPTRLEGKVARIRVQLALAMLNRRDAAERRGRAASRRPRASVEQIDRELGTKLDALARRLGEQVE